MSVQIFFPTSVSIEDLPSTRAGKLNEGLVREAYAYQELDRAGKEWSKKNYPAGYTSYSSISDLPFRSSQVKGLQKWIDGHVSKFAQHLEMDLKKGKLRMSSCWVNVMGRFAHHSFHLHPLSAISGTYYVQVPKDSGTLKIEDPRLGLFMGSPPRKASAGTRNRRFIEITPKAGRLILFESWLKHEVPANLSKDDRISISFNYDWV